MQLDQKLSSQLDYPDVLSRFMANQLEENSQDDYQKNIEENNEELSLSFNKFLSKFQTSNLTRENYKQVRNAEVILLVDDTPNNLRVLFSYLEAEGFKVLLAEDGESALKIAQSEIPDLILMDVLMPDIDGFETCRRLKSQRLTKDIPVIFLTALSETVNKVQGFKLGGVDYITKPIEQEEVLVRIQTHLNLQKMRHALAMQNQELQRALDFEAIVRRITNKLRDNLDESYILKTATKELVSVLNISSCQIELYNCDCTTATIGYEYTSSLPKCQGATREIKDFPELYQQLLQKIPIQLVEKIPEFLPQGIQVTRLACPIFDNNAIIGNLWGLRPPGEIFNDLEIQLMQQIASQCAIALRQARLYKASNQLNEELSKLNRLKDDFLKTISHELKAPMTSIQIAAQTMQTIIKKETNPKNSPTFNRVLEIFRESCQRQKELVDDLLSLCHIDAKAQSLQPEWIDLHLWIPELSQFYLARTKDQEQELILDLRGEKLHIMADPIILGRIIREFLNNACKYTPAKEKITVKTEANDLQISVCIINTGIEIDLEEQKLIFNQFYRIPNNDPWKYGGTGLGLALAKKLAEILEASIDVESTNKQTVFCIRFPKQN